MKYEIRRKTKMVLYHFTRCPICEHEGIWTSNNCVDEVESLIYRLREHCTTIDSPGYKARGIEIEKKRCPFSDDYRGFHEWQQKLSKEYRDKNQMEGYNNLPGYFTALPNVKLMNATIYFVLKKEDRLDGPIIYPDIYKNQPNGIVCPNCKNKVRYLETIIDENGNMCSKSYKEQRSLYFREEKKKELDAERVTVISNIEPKQIKTDDISIVEYLENLVNVADDIMFLENDICLLYSSSVVYNYYLASIREEILDTCVKKETDYIKGIKRQIKETESEKAKLKEITALDRANIIKKEGIKIPSTPTPPSKPKEPILNQVKIEKEFLVRPCEPDYKKSNLFNKKKVEEENNIKKEEYEKSLKRYEEEKQKEENNKSSREKYEAELAQYNELMSQYNEAFDKYCDEKKKFEETCALNEEKINAIADKMVKERIESEEPVLNERLVSLNQELEQAQKDKESGRLLDSILMEDEDYKKTKIRLTIYEHEMEEASLKTKELYLVLKEILSANLIYEKYNDIVVWNTFYEYFITGRVTELGGPNGAYNLYESERRANIIISKLDDILLKLEEIKENQYTLYRAIKENNALLEKIEERLNSISIDTSNLRDIKLQGEKTNDYLKNTNDYLNEIYKTEVGIAYRTQMIEKYTKISANSTKALAFMKVIFG